MTYSEIKTWFAEHKKEMVIGACFGLMFLVGFGTGRYDREVNRQNRLQQNYTIKQGKDPTPAEGEVKGAAAPAKTEAVQPATANKKSAVGDCRTKGNISGSKRTYHVPGGAFYERTKAEQCFDTEEQAAAAGFTKSSR